VTDGDPPVVVPSDDAIADLKLLMRGVRLALPALGGTQSAPRAGELAPGTARLGVQPAVAQAAAESGALVIADQEGRPLARLTDVSLDLDGEGNSFVSGRVEPTAPDGWRLPAVAGGTVVVALRPLLKDDVERLTRLDGGAAVAVPQAGASPDGVPADVLLDAVQAAVDGTAVPVVPLELRLAAADDLPGLWDGVRSAFGAAAIEPLDVADVQWRALRTSLDGATPGQSAESSASEAVLAVLRRWRAPRAARGLVVLFTGLSGSGKSTLARALAPVLRSRGRTVSLLDGDLVRRMLSSGLGFDRASRDLNVRRIGFVASEVARHGGVAICAPIAPYADSRAAVRAMASEVGDFLLVHVSTPLAECERRDVKGLYARARAGQIEHFTGITDPYEEPLDADLTIDTSRLGEQEALTHVVALLEQGGWVTRPEQA
jgi:sulfate adenylyltransferase